MSFLTQNQEVWKSIEDDSISNGITLFCLDEIHWKIKSTRPIKISKKARVATVLVVL